MQFEPTLLTPGSWVVVSLMWLGGSVLLGGLVTLVARSGVPDLSPWRTWAFYTGLFALFLLVVGIVLWA